MFVPTMNKIGSSLSNLFLPPFREIRAGLQIIRKTQDLYIFRLGWFWYGCLKER